MHVISILVTAVAFGVVLHAVPSYGKTSPAVEDDSIHPFRVSAPEEIVYVLEGSLEYQLEGKPPSETAFNSS